AARAGGDTAGGRRFRAPRRDPGGGALPIRHGDFPHRARQRARALASGGRAAADPAAEAAGGGRVVPGGGRRLRRADPGRDRARLRTQGQERNLMSSPSSSRAGRRPLRAARALGPLAAACVAAYGLWAQKPARASVPPAAPRIPVTVVSAATQDLP